MNNIKRQLYKQAHGFTIPLSITNIFDPYPHGSPLLIVFSFIKIKIYTRILTFSNSHNIQNAIQNYSQTQKNFQNTQNLQNSSLIFLTIH